MGLVRRAQVGYDVVNRIFKIRDERGKRWRNFPGDNGGSVPFTEHVLSTDVADWTPDATGTWSDSGGVISQTDDTGDSALTLIERLASLEYIIEAEIRIPTGQDAATEVLAMLVVGNFNAPGDGAFANAYGNGALIRADAVGDGSGFTVSSVFDASESALFPVAIAQGEWHTLRAVTNDSRQNVYLDGECIFSNVDANGGDAANPGPPLLSNDFVTIGAVGLVDFRNLKVWTQTLPA